jgi:ABC-type glucose/galactose transport system permease subunit
MKKWAYILLGLWLVLTGLLALGGIRFSGSRTFVAVLGIVAGILFLPGDRSEKMWPRLESILLGVWLLASGLIPLLHIRFDGSGVLLAVLSVAAGIVVLIRRFAGD